MMDKLSAIRALTDAGFRLIPLHGKIPPSGLEWKAVPHGKYGEKELANTNYGIAIPDDYMIVDVDVRNFTPGDNPLKRLVEDVGTNFTVTFRVKSGGGGWHIYLRIPKGFRMVGKLKAYKGIDFKHVGGYVVGPGSIHPDTKKEYFVCEKSPSEIIDAPEELLKLIKRSDTSLSSQVGTKEFKDDKATRERYAAYLRENAEVSVEGDGGDDTAFKVAARARDLALSPAVAYELLLSEWNDRCQPPWTPEELRGKVLHAYRYATGVVGASHPAAAFENDPLPVEIVEGANAVARLATAFVAPDGEVDEEGLHWAVTSQGAIQKNYVNLENYLRTKRSALHKIFAYNEFVGEIVFVAPAPWHKGRLPEYPTVTDDDLKLTKSYLAHCFKFESPLSEILEAVVVVSKDQAFHPVRDYLESLKWDGVPRLNTWMQKYLGARETADKNVPEKYQAYIEAVSRKTLCAAVMRILTPGCKWDHVPVLEGSQDLGKSTVCRILGGKWSADFTVDPHNKDTIALMNGKWFIELAELEITGRTETDALKAFLTRQSDKVRLAYAHLTREFPRQSLFFATKNPGADGTYLKDDTGNRRWWPVKCHAVANGQFDFAGLASARDQLLAEAVVMVRDRGELLYMDTPELKQQALEVVALRHAPHSWTDRIGGWIETQTPKREFLTPRDIFIDAMGGIDKQLDRRAETAIGRAMNTLGWMMVEKVVGDRAVRGYVKIKRGLLNVHAPINGVVRNNLVEALADFL